MGQQLIARELRDTKQIARDLQEDGSSLLGTDIISNGAQMEVSGV